MNVKRKVINKGGSPTTLGFNGFRAKSAGVLVNCTFSEVAGGRRVNRALLK